MTSFTLVQCGKMHATCKIGLPMLCEHYIGHVIDVYDMANVILVADNVILVAE